MSLLRLQVSNVRNIRALRLESLATVNVIVGKNGSGKTTLLEAIHLLGLARSFRNQATRSLISHESQLATVFGEVEAAQGLRLPLGVQRLRSGDSRINIGGRPATGLAELAEQFPLQVVDAQSFDLITGPPLGRRQYLDWGVFHVEHRFYREWLAAQRALKQRNQLLRGGSARHSSASGGAGELSGLQAWTKGFVAASIQITEWRREYFNALLPRFKAVAAQLSPALSGAELRFRPGWNATMPLEEALAANLASDRERGFTQLGPQRAEVRIVVEGRSAAETLSRGQQKLLAAAMKLAQGLVFAEHSGRRCTYLIDDLPAELDEAHAARVCEVLSGMGAQVFITCVRPDDIMFAWPRTADRQSLQVFHVEHGTVTPAP